ncbi:MAG: hypothetical protein EBX36_11090 [Planctomycetia bacterium]|nr:hypothetical protein [Planctomycetia bacterium]
MVRGRRDRPRRRATRRGRSLGGSRTVSRRRRRAARRPWPDGGTAGDGGSAAPGGGLGRRRSAPGGPRRVPTASGGRRALPADLLPDGHAAPVARRTRPRRGTPPQGRLPRRPPRRRAARVGRHGDAAGGCRPRRAVSPLRRPRAGPQGGRMTQPAVPPHAVSIPPSEPCWRRIGTDGDRTCPELTTHVHCRNCPVLAEAARRFFDRPAPAGYVDAWQEILAAPANAPRGVARSVLVFRLGAEWLALPTTAVAGVALPRRPRRIPHRSDGVLAGLVAVHGQLELCLRLDRLLGVATTSAPADESAGARLLVLTWRQERWAAVVKASGAKAD